MHELSESKPKRRPRLTPDPARARRARLYLSGRDLEIFWHLYRAGRLHTRQIDALVRGAARRAAPRGQHYDPGEVVQRRLRLLFDHGYVLRLPGQEHYVFKAETGGYGGTRPLVYGLSAKGGRELAAHRSGVQVDRLRWDKLNREIRQPQIEHALLVSDCYVAWELALEAQPELQELFWYQGLFLKRVFWTDEAGTLVSEPELAPAAARRVVFPDSFFGLTLPAAAGGGREALYFMLEADRATMSQARMVKKYQDLWRYNRLGLHTRHWRDARGQGIRSFIVLTVTTTESRRDLLTALARQADDRAQGSRFFRFAWRGDFANNPAQFFAPIWRTPVDSQPIPLVS
jgi:hypothetical protein